MRPHAFLLTSLAASLLLAYTPRAHAQAQAVSAEERAAFHQDPQWLAIAPHLPDPKTASAAQLELEGDVLQARRFPEDALDYYGYAVARGGSLNQLLNKMGIVRLQLRQIDLAHELFERTVRVNKKDAVGWNNLGATEYVNKHYRNAISDYRRAIRLDKRSSTYHVNIGMAFFESGDMDGARKEFAVALNLDPHTFEHRDFSGTKAQVVGTQNYSQLAFEMAKVYARHQNAAETILWLSKATEAGFDVKYEMQQDASLRPYARDPRVILMLKNAKEMKARSVAVSTPTQGLGAASEEKKFD